MSRQRRTPSRPLLAFFYYCSLSVGLIGIASCLASSSSVVVTSTNRNGGHSRTFRLLKDSDVVATTPIQTSTTSRVLSPLAVRSKLPQLSNFLAGLRSTFLPAGYPQSTPVGYLNYAIWSWIQDLSTQLRSVLATQRVLEGVGVGREGATALSALLNFLVRDGCGMAATLLFTAVSASRFKADVKRWRLFADIMVDVGITLEIAAAQVPQQWFLPFISVGNICKAVCGVAAGACGGAINVHWAKGSDISDIQAKFGAQQTVSGSLGLVFAALFAKAISKQKHQHVWLWYSALTALHIAANRHCMRLIAFDSYNTVRLDMALREFFSQLDEQQQQQQQQWSNQSNATESPLQLTLSTPLKISRSEKLLFLPFRPTSSGRGRTVYPIHVGVSFDEFVDKSHLQSNHAAAVLAAQQQQEPQPTTRSYWISTGYHGKKPCVMVVFQKGVSPLDQTKAYFHATLLSRRLAQLMQQATKDDATGDTAAAASSSSSSSSSSMDRIMVQAERTAAEQVEQAWKMFAEASQAAGWDLYKTELETRGYEIEIQHA